MTRFGALGPFDLAAISLRLLLFAPFGSFGSFVEVGLFDGPFGRNSPFDEREERC